MSLDVHYNATHFANTLSAAAFNAPAGCIGDAEIEAAAGIQATKVERQFNVYDEQTPGSAVVAKTKLAHIAKAAGSVVGIDAVTTTVATGGDRTVTIDLQKSTAGGAFATVLSAVVTLNNSSVVRTVYSGVISSAAFVAGDIFQIVTAVAGAAGAQAAGLQVTVTLREDPQ